MFMIIERVFIMQTGQLKPTQILETALYVRDIEEAVPFYRDILGLELALPYNHRNAFFRCGAGILLIFDAKETIKPARQDALPIPTHGTTGAGHMCFAASREDIAMWKEHFAKHGIEIEREFDWPNGARSLYIRDPSGNSLEFAEPKLWNNG